MRELYNYRLNESGAAFSPTTKRELQELIYRRIEEQGPNCDLNDIDVSRITDMSNLFMDYSNLNKFNGDISKWNVSNVKDMNYMFANSKFNGDISKWDVSNVKYMNGMFASSKFNGDLSKWDVSKVIDMSNMFASSDFNGDISNWDVRKVNNMHKMFYQSLLDGKEPRWYNDVF